MNSGLKSEIKVWSVYFITLLLSSFFHELGHCIPAWAHGYTAIPTLAKGYPSNSIPHTLTDAVAFGGVFNSFLFSILAIILFLKSSYKYRSSLLAGSLAMPGAYTLRFILLGRGHDSTEFQEAQSAIGLSYSGHAVDWLFIIVLILGTAIWIRQSKPTINIWSRLVIGAITSVIFIVAVQTINNRIFDPIFS